MARSLDVSRASIERLTYRQLDALARILHTRGERTRCRQRDGQPQCLCGRVHAPEPPDPEIPPGLADACSALLTAHAANDDRAELAASIVLAGFRGL